MEGRTRGRATGGSGPIVPPELGNRAPIRPARFTEPIWPSTVGDVEDITGHDPVRDEDGFDLDDEARLALNVARHAALANGDPHCGTEYLLYGLIATAKGDMTELAELFALNTMRIDLGIERLLAHRAAAGVTMSGPPQLSIRATQALMTPRLDHDGSTGPFEVLHGVLADDDSGACRVLRDLGVTADDARRLVAYGIRHLSKAEVDDLIATLDRRAGNHEAWWGPSSSSRLQPVVPGVNLPVVIAESATARIEMTAIATDGVGLGFTTTTRSLRPWVLPPVFIPEESLVPGEGARYSDGPDFFLLQVHTIDGFVVDNRSVDVRFRSERPDQARLIQLGQREERTSLNDRRQADQTVITVDWWMWPVPALDSSTTSQIEMRVDWPAESVNGARAIPLSVTAPS